MKKQFTTEELINSKGCYSLNELKKCSFYKENSIIDVKDIINSEITIKDKMWFLYQKCELSNKIKIEYAAKFAWAVLPIYKDKYPNANRVENCLIAINDFKENKISKLELKKAASYVAYAAYAAPAASYVAYAASCSAYAAAYAAAYVGHAAVNAAYAAYVGHAAHEATAAVNAAYAAHAATAASDSVYVAADAAIKKEVIKLMLEIIDKEQ